MKTGPPLIHHSYSYCLMCVYKVFKHFGEYSTKDEKHLTFMFFPEGNLSMAAGTIHHGQALTPFVSLLFPALPAGTNEDRQVLSYLHKLHAHNTTSGKSFSNIYKFELDSRISRGIRSTTIKLVTTPIFVFLNWTKLFHIHVDASTIALGIGLTQPE